MHYQDQREKEAAAKENDFRLDCLMRNKLSQLKKNKLTKQQVKEWFFSMPDDWKNSENRIERMHKSVNSVR